MNFSTDYAKPWEKVYNLRDKVKYLAILAAIPFLFFPASYLVNRLGLARINHHLGSYPKYSDPEEFGGDIFMLFDLIHGSSDGYQLICVENVRDLPEHVQSCVHQELGISQKTISVPSLLNLDPSGFQAPQVYTSMGDIKGGEVGLVDRVLGSRLIDEANNRETDIDKWIFFNLSQEQLSLIKEGELYLLTTPAYRGQVASFSYMIFTEGESEFWLAVNLGGLGTLSYKQPVLSTINLPDDILLED
jgi:hypothetical protein